MEQEETLSYFTTLPRLGGVDARKKLVRIYKFLILGDLQEKERKPESGVAFAST